MKKHVIERLTSLVGCLYKDLNVLNYFLLACEVIKGLWP
jgi:hypothetical protein